MTRGPIRSWNSGSRLSSSGPGTSLPTGSNAGSTAAEIVRQGLYPYAKGGPVTYTPPGQRIAEGLPWGGAISAGWYQSSLEFLHYMVDQGLPETNPVIPADRGSPRLPCPPLSRPSGPGSPWRSADWWLCRWRPRGCVATSSPRPGRPAEDPIGSGRRARYLNAGASEHDLLAIMLDDAHRGRPESGAVLGTGTAFIAWEPDDRDYFGYWDSLPDGPASALEQMPRTGSLEEAIEWGRQRTSRILIRPESDPGEYYWAGVGEPQGLDTDLRRLDV
jgi:hypothetical protein